MVKDQLDGINVVFDDDRSVADAGVLLVATLARKLGIEALVNECVDLGRRVGYFRPGRKVLSLMPTQFLGHSRTIGARACGADADHRARRSLTALADQSTYREWAVSPAPEPTA